MNNPQVYDHSALLAMTDKEIAIAQYEFIVAFMGLCYITFLLIIMFNLIIWISPKFWRKRKRGNDVSYL